MLAYSTSSVNKRIIIVINNHYLNHLPSTQVIHACRVTSLDWNISMECASDLDTTVCSESCLHSL